MKTNSYIKFFIRKLLNLININCENILNKLYKLPFLEKPLPKKINISNIGSTTKNKYLELHSQAIKKENQNVIEFEKRIGFKLDKDWFNEVSLLTQTTIKNSELNFNHGRLLYALVCKYIKNSLKAGLNKITILETGTARGFSSLCMSKAINDLKANGKVITIDCISHNRKMYWGCISDFSGKKTREELLLKWEKELSNIIFIQGWTTETLKKLGLNRIHFAFLDAQHTKDAVIKEFEFINKRQIKGDIIFFDDVTPNVFEGVCDAVKEIEKNYSYEIKYLPFDLNRGYAIATKI